MRAIFTDPTPGAARRAARKRCPEHVVSGCVSTLIAFYGREEAVEVECHVDR